MPRAVLSPSDRLLVKLTSMSDPELVSLRNIATALLAERKRQTPAAKPAKKRKKKPVVIGTLGDPAV